MSYSVFKNGLGHSLLTARNSYVREPAVSPIDIDIINSDLYVFEIFKFLAHNFGNGPVSR